MDRDTSPTASLPDWYINTFESVQRIEGGLRNLELEVHQALETRPLDPTVRAELQGLLNSLRAMKGKAVLIDMAAHSAVERQVAVPQPLSA